MPHYNSNIIAKPLIVENKMIIVDNEWNEIFTYNISDFSNIQLLSSIRLNSEIHKLIYHSELFLCSSNYYGMIILENSPILSVKEIETNNKTRNNLNIYPNPFKSITTINYILRERSLMNIEIFNQSGRKIKSLLNKDQDEGVHNVYWDGTDNNKHDVPTGFYFIKIRYGKKNESRKVIIIR